MVVGHEFLQRVRRIEIAVDRPARGDAGGEHGGVLARAVLGEGRRPAAGAQHRVLGVVVQRKRRRVGEGVPRRGPTAASIRRTPSRCTGSPEWLAHGERDALVVEVRSRRAGWPPPAVGLFVLRPNIGAVDGAPRQRIDPSAAEANHRAAVMALDEPGAGHDRQHRRVVPRVVGHGIEARFDTSSPSSSGNCDEGPADHQRLPRPGRLVYPDRLGHRRRARPARRLRGDRSPGAQVAERAARPGGRSRRPGDRAGRAGCRREPQLGPAAHELLRRLGLGAHPRARQLPPQRRRGRLHRRALRRPRAARRSRARRRPRRGQGRAPLRDRRRLRRRAVPRRRRASPVGARRGRHRHDQLHERHHGAAEGRRADAIAPCGSTRPPSDGTPA